MKCERVSFSCHPGVFRVSVSHCHNPECLCHAVTFDLVEVVENREEAQEPLRLRTCVDTETWSETEPAPRSAGDAEIVREFLRDYPLAEREMLRERDRRKRRRADRLAEYRFNADHLSGELVSFGQVIDEEGKHADDQIFDTFDYDGGTYYVIDYYCANPLCECEEVRLQFLLGSQEDGREVAKLHFEASLSLDGKLNVEEIFEGTEAQSSAIATAWWEPDALVELRWRYQKIKEIARRSMPDVPGLPAPALPMPMRRPSVRLGRNDPCPCGSGKKYKKCCGR